MKAALLAVPVVAHFAVGNGVVDSVRSAARDLGLGPVTVTGFEHNCSPIPGEIVVCRDPSLTHGATSTTRSPSCVVRLDPRLGGGRRGRMRIEDALAMCL